MKNRHAHILTAVLLMLFSCRIIIPICLQGAADNTTAIEQQEEKSADTNDYAIMYESDLPVSYTSTLMQACSIRRFPVTSHALPPVHYMSIPTPPPWFKS